MKHEEPGAVDRPILLCPFGQQAVVVLALLHEGSHALNEGGPWAWQVLQNNMTPPAAVDFPKSGPTCTVPCSIKELPLQSSCNSAYDMNLQFGWSAGALFHLSVYSFIIDLARIWTRTWTTLLQCQTPGNSIWTRPRITTLLHC